MPMPRSYTFTRGPQKRKDEKTARLRRGGKWAGPLSRRGRMIHAALLRSSRRWDTYAARVVAEELDGEASAKTHEWRLILQNGRLLRRIRGLSEDTIERSVRVTYGLDPLHLPTLPIREGVRKQESSGRSARPTPGLPRLWIP